MVFPWENHDKKELSGCISKDESGPEDPLAGAQEESLDDDHRKNPRDDTVMPALAAGNDRLRKFLDQLEAAQIEGIELPMICVVGDTSSGKSSVLSQLSMVELPASSTLTTRCPVQIHMSKADERKAAVGIQWKEICSNPPDYDQDVRDWKEIPDHITRAQTLILEHTGKDVTADAIITVKIQDSNCINLTLVDLPGLVHTVSSRDNEKPDMVRDIHDMIQQYMNHPKSITVAIVPATVDFHNSYFLGKLKQNSIAVITKPDLIDKGAEDEVLKLLLNQKIPLRQGFHMIKGRGQASQQSSIEQGLEEERNFFETVYPWCEIADPTFLGTDNLRRKLGNLQIEMIQQDFPGILKELRRRREELSVSLKQLGPLYCATSDRRSYFQDVCQRLISSLHASVTGKGFSSSKLSAAAKLHLACDKFVRDIQHGPLGSIKEVTEGAMVLVVCSSSSSGPSFVRGEVVHMDKHFACVDFVEPEDQFSTVLFDQTGIPSTESIKENYVWSDGSKIFIGRSGNSLDLMRKIPFSQIRSDPHWLKERITENRTSELPCFLNVDIFKNIVCEFIEEDWRPHCSELLRETGNALSEAVKEAIQTSIPSDRYPQLHELVNKQCRQAASSLMEEADRQLQSHLSLEKHPYTQDPTLFQNITEARNRVLKQELYSTLRLEQDAVYDTSAIRDLIDQVLEKQKKRSVEDVMAEELEHVLSSYGEVATRRVMDRVPMICWESFRQLTARLQDTLWSITDEALEEHMQDTPEFARKHNYMTTELERINKAFSIIELL